MHDVFSILGRQAPTGSSSVWPQLTLMQGVCKPSCMHHRDTSADQRPAWPAGLLSSACWAGEAHQQLLLSSCVAGLQAHSAPWCTRVAMAALVCCPLPAPSLLPDVRAAHPQPTGLPRVLVDVRHEGSHNALPSLPLLRLAAAQALNWLRAAYWRRQLEHLRDQEACIVQILQVRAGLAAALAAVSVAGCSMQHRAQPAAGM